ncbi:MULTISPECIES: class I SAM-dependent methyltransferase [Peptoniphilaceae]|uniref:Methyltransferase domain protein n=2 Tax=Finegoldia magna TaxID=1260 RepID=E1KZP9_FINMA|nr:MULTISPECIES: class I SAM-dependent methyltransferase [Peptoniphilaceae]EFL53476.1 methyltransferase domain protein [Finegoldia magna BVS033A4]MDU5742877.1 class I SAM-dependent methyltransferase [Finegoldia magna]MDU5924743.1 class I SAM-dependent methyltransferase [Finegoldia magna]MDU6599242.1 class I SAM-dependent methyltransferase [Finegoldia magna]MDU7165632.1 class I SAM-dependent methyltransferase [Finegoldia magna]
MEKNKIVFGHDFLKMLGRTRLRPGGGIMTDWLLDQVQIDKDMQVLEVACNRGDNLIRVYTKYKCKVIGIDNDQVVIDQALENIKLLGLDKEIEVMNIDALKLDFEDETFDLIINEAMLTMLPNEEKAKALKNYHRVLKKGGYLLTHDVAVENESEDIRRQLSKFTNMNVYPLTVENWNKLFIENSFRPFSQRTGRMLLLDRDTIIKDEGPVGAANFYKNAYSEENRDRFVKMLERSKNTKISYVVLASKKED